MILVNTAKELVENNVNKLDLIIVELSDACGMTLASDVVAPIAQPAFTQSSMDGYAIHHLDITALTVELRLQGESRAGTSDQLILNKGEAIRIFTGAPVPEGATAVIMQEHTTRVGDKVCIHEYPVPDGKNIRKIGQQIKEGEVALAKGSLIGPGAIGFLGGFGVQKVCVYRQPKVAILVTGDELVEAGDKPLYGQIFESNAATLRSALIKEGIQEVRIAWAKDEPSAVVSKLKELALWADVILTSGGISVGDYDFVEEALLAVGVENVFYKIRQKPGKPLFFGKRGPQLYFALPGNPASSLVCFYEYVLPALRGMAGREDINLLHFKLPSNNYYSFTGERDEFLKAFVENGSVTLLYGQESFALRSFAKANAIVYLPVSQQQVAVGDMVEVHLLPV